MTISLVAVLIVAAALVATGVFAATWRRELTAAIAGIPLMLGGVGVAFVGASRFSAAQGPELFGQAVAILLGVAALALVALGLGIAGRESGR